MLSYTNVLKGMKELAKAGGKPLYVVDGVLQGASSRAKILSLLHAIPQLATSPKDGDAPRA